MRRLLPGPAPGHVRAAARGSRRRLLGSRSAARQPCRSSRVSGACRGSRHRWTCRATRSAFRPSAGPGAWTSRAPPGFCTRRTASSRWISRGAAPPGSSRRSSARAPLPLDREIRIHRFRAEARRAVSLLSADDRAVLEAYTAGVNAGLEALSAPPFEYLLLRQTPAPWRRKTACWSCSRCSSRCRTTTARTRPRWRRCTTCCRRPCSSSWRREDRSGTRRSSATPFAVPPIPGPEVYDLRDAYRQARRPVPPPRRPISDSRSGVRSLGTRVRTPWRARPRRSAATTSPSPGRLTADGGALVANDMHLDDSRAEHLVPRALEWPDPDDAATPQPSHRRHAARRPGTRRRQQHAHRLGIHQHLRRLERHRPARRRSGKAERVPHTGRAGANSNAMTKSIAVAGQPDAAPARCSWTIWGPVLEPDHRGRPRAYRWVAHSAERLAVSVTPLESARTIEEAFDEANGLGTPGQNMVVADRYRTHRLERLRLDPAAQSASTASCPHRGPTAHDAGTAG